MTSEDLTLFLEDFCDFLDGLEASVAKMKRQIAKLVGITEEEKAERKWSWSPEKIKWQTAQGVKGEFEKSDDTNSLDFKNMVKDLSEHGGKLTRDSYFYWVFKNGSTVGRKKKQA